MNSSTGITICSNCGKIADKGHACTEEPLKTEGRRPGSWNTMIASLCREDKEQLDRIEAKLDRFLTSITNI